MHLVPCVEAVDDAVGHADDGHVDILGADDVGNGEEDVACIDDARNYHALLEELGIAHHYHEGPGGHDWNYWDENLAKLLAWFTQTK